MTFGSHRCSVHGMDFAPGMICPKCEAETTVRPIRTEESACSYCVVSIARPVVRVGDHRLCVDHLMIATALLDNLMERNLAHPITKKGT